jgi:hypothetical protein
MSDSGGGSTVNPNIRYALYVRCVWDPPHEPDRPSRRDESTYHEYVVMPGVTTETQVISMVMWSRLVTGAGRRPKWHATQVVPFTNPQPAQRISTYAQNSEVIRRVNRVLEGHGRPQSSYKIEDPIVVEVTVADVFKAPSKTPYHVLRRVDKVRAVRAAKMTA